MLNFILDYFFVAILGLGVRRSAYASLIVEVISIIILALYFLCSSDRLCFRRFRFDGKVLTTMLLNGSSEFIGEAASAISMLAFNYSLMKYVGPDGVAAFTILGMSVYSKKTSEMKPGRSFMKVSHSQVPRSASTDFPREPEFPSCMFIRKMRKSTTCFPERTGNN